MSNVNKFRKFMVLEKIDKKTLNKSMFCLVEESLPPLEKNKFLVQAEYISVDPYMWSFAWNQQVPYLQFGFQVGKIVASKNDDYPVDSYVVSHAGWCDFAILDGEPDEIFGMRPYKPPVGNLSRSLAVGALGMPGMTAYLGLLEICKPKKDCTVCVTGACGAVGSLVGQIARIKNCKVIGFTGSDEKVQILTNVFGFHHGFNYKTEKNIQSALKAVAPNGIDCFFDNVGGELSNSIIECMSKESHVAICGAISMYGKHSTRQRLPINCMSTRIEAFSFTQWERSQQLDAINQIREWIEKGDVIARETITNGFENLPTALISMLNGENIGKAVVKI